MIFLWVTRDYSKIHPEIPDKLCAKNILGVNPRIHSIIRLEITAEMHSFRYFSVISTEIHLGIILEISPRIS